MYLQYNHYTNKYHINLLTYNIITINTLYITPVIL